MANEVKLEVYTFKVRKKRTNDYERLTDFLGTDITTFIKDYFHYHDKNMLINDELKKSLQVISDKLTFNSSKRMISGIIESGDYGIETKIVSNKGQKKFTRSITDIEIKPFYFLVHIPEDSQIGFIIIQRIGVYGITNIFKDNLEQYFNHKYEDYKIEYGQYLSKELANKFISDGMINELIFRRYDLPQDVADRLNLPEISGDIQVVEIKIKAKRKHSFQINDRVKKFVKNPNTNFFEIPSLKDLGFDGAHESSVRIKLGDKTRTIDLSETGQIKPYYDIDEEVIKNKSTGHPEFNSIDKIAKELITSITHSQ